MLIWSKIISFLEITIIFLTGFNYFPILDSVHVVLKQDKTFVAKL